MTAQRPAPDPDEPAPTDADDIHPIDMLRAMLASSPEDAAAARGDAAETMNSGGPTQER